MNHVRKLQMAKRASLALIKTKKIFPHCLMKTEILQVCSLDFFFFEEKKEI